MKKLLQIMFFWGFAVACSSMGSIKKDSLPVLRVFVSQKDLASFKEVTDIFAGVRLEPVFSSSSRIMGFKIVQLISDGFYYRLGLRTGDVILKINGEPFDSMARLHGVFHSLKTNQKNFLKMNMQRDGKDFYFYATEKRM